MRVRIITIGSQGDLRPYMASGAGPHAPGRDVCIVGQPVANIRVAIPDLRRKQGAQPTERV